MEETKLELLSKELKTFLAKYDTQSALGHLSFLMTCIANGTAQEELGMLASPMRQLYYLAGLIVSQKKTEATELQFSTEDWTYIVDLLSKIELEYYKLFIPEFPDLDSEQREKWIRIAMPTFLSYFNLGPLNYEEQLIEQILGTFISMNDVIVNKTGVKTEDFLQFYENLDAWCQYNFKSLNHISDTVPLRDNWRDYSNINIGIIDEAIDEIKEYGESIQPKLIFITDPGIKNRFKLSDIATNGLSEDTVQSIINLLSIDQKDTDFLYYTGQNPLLTHPIVRLDNGLYQVFEEKRILHALIYALEEICKTNEASKSRLAHNKGLYLESKIESLFKKFFGKKAEIISNYFIDGCEQDIMILWNNYMFIVEAKAYNNREPFRNSEKAYTRIKDDFNKCIGYAYAQTRRVEEKIRAGEIFNLYDHSGNIIRTINPKDYDGNDFYIIINQESFGLVQIDLSLLLSVEGDYNYPWAVRYDDLEVFLLTLMEKKKRPEFFIDFLMFREYLHGHIVSFDEGEICGGFLSGKLTYEMADSTNMIITCPDLATIFDEQYRKGMGFKNEKYLNEKRSGNTIFW